MAEQNTKNYPYTKKYHFSSESEEKRHREEVLIERMLKCLDVQPSKVKETQYFQRKSHDSLCVDIETWVNKLQVFLGEFIWIEQNQSLKDEGVDLLVHFIESHVKFGFQIKSHGDISEKTFSTKVDAQILRTKKHDISAFFIFFGGNLNDRSHFERVRQKISSISQMGVKNVYCINPEKFYTITKTIRNNNSPMNVLNFQDKDIPIISKALIDILSNEKRDVSLNLLVKYKNIPENLGGSVSFSVAIPEEDVEFSKKFRDIQNLTEKLVIPKEYITNFKVKGFSGAGEEGIPDYMEITPEKYLGFVDFISLDNEGNEIAKMIKIPYKMVQKEGIITTFNTNTGFPFSFEFISNPKNKYVETKFNIDVHKGNAKQNYETLNFLKTLKKGNQLKTTLYSIHGQSKGTVIRQYNIDLQVDEKSVEFWKILAFVEQETGINFSFKEKNIFTEQNWLLLLQIYHGLKTGKMGVSIKATISISRLIVLNILDDAINGREMKELGIRNQVEVEVYNQKINLGPINILTKNYKVIGNLEEQKQKALKSEEQYLELSLDISGNVEGKLEWFPRKKKESKNT
jgi:hypothetical protein